ncbi:MAG: hypothetical protein V1725_06000 [archaeon]
MQGLLYRLRTELHVSQEEWKQFFITLAVLAVLVTLPLAITFPGKGILRVNVDLGLPYLMKAFLLLGSALLLHVLVQKMFALYLGYRAQYRFWVNGLLIGVFFAFFTLGFPAKEVYVADIGWLSVYLAFFVPLSGTVDLFHDEKMRLGRFRYSANMKDLARVAFSGVLANIFALIILQAAFLTVKGTVIGDILINFIAANMLLAFFSMLPLPSCDGLSVFRSSRIGYVFLLAFVIIFLGLLTLGLTVQGMGVFSLIAATLLASLVAYLYNKTVES